VTKRFAGLVANNAVDLDVRAGEVHALIGPNGAGKSTFFNMISGVDDPTEGQVRLMGQVMAGKPSRAFAALGLGRTFQHVRLLGERSVLENVALGAHQRGHRGWVASMLRLDRAEEAAVLAEAMRQIERCGLADVAHTPAASLPLGQQRIVEIARALAGQPAVLLLDEPAAGLRHLEKQSLADAADPAARRRAGDPGGGARHGIRHEPGRPHHRAGVRHRHRPRHAGRGAGQPARDRGLPGGGRAVSAPLLSLPKFSVFYGPVQAIHGIALHVGEGEIVTVIGPNGAGKTTLLNAIMGLLPSQGG
jgi:ABC-type branched-subunit amino acid transport system ATPase component